MVTINIVNFDNIKLDEFHTCFHIWEDDHPHYLLTDVLEIHFINMVKFKKQKTKDIVHKPLERWMTYFDKDTPEALLQEVIQMDAAISKANERLNFVSQDKEFLRNYHMREMAMSDLTTAVNTGIERGIQIGEQRGIQIGEERGEKKRAIEVARRLLAFNRPIDEIAAITGLTRNEIKLLR